MAYRRTTRKTTSRRSPVRRTTRRSGATRSRRTSTRSRSSASRSPQTVRIVIEQPSASAVARPLVQGQDAPPPRTNKF